MKKKKKSNPKPKASDGCEKHRFSGSVWCDDHADVYIGTKSHLVELVTTQNHDATIKFKAEAKCCDYLYFVCWSNDYGENGLLAEVQGGSIVRTGDNNKWEVFATGIDKDNNYDRPAPLLINNQLAIATWTNPFVGSPNNSAGQPWGGQISGITTAAKFIWHNSGNDTSGTWPSADYAPFNGFDHNEFLIFRFPISRLFEKACRDCECCEEIPLCNSVCTAYTTIENSELTRFKNNKQFQIDGAANGSNCTNPNVGEPCGRLDLPKIKPCFFFNWGDSPTDKIETHDTEIVYITVCNPYENIGFKGLKILSIEIVPPLPPLPSGDPAIRITPSKLISFGCLDACCCVSREFALLTRGAMAQGYQINVEYCIDEIIVKEQNRGSNSFKINVTSS